MSERLSVVQILMLCAYATVMAGGQLLFKLAALRSVADAPLGARMVALVQDWAFLLALAINLGLAVAWVWILSFTPLSRAYPFLALAIALTPFVAALVFGEPLTVRFAVGVGVIFLGLILVAQ